MEITYTKHGDYYYPRPYTPSRTDRGYRLLRAYAEEVFERASARHIRVDAYGKRLDTTSHRDRPTGNGTYRPHSCASLLLSSGVPMKQIQEWLGHSDFSTTANIYSHLEYSSKLISADSISQSLDS